MSPQNGRRGNCAKFKQLGPVGMDRKSCLYILLEYSELTGTILSDHTYQLDQLFVYLAHFPRLPCCGLLKNPTPSSMIRVISYTSRKVYF